MTGKTSKPDPEYNKVHTKISNLKQYFSPNYRYNRRLSPTQVQDRLSEIKGLEKVRAKMKSTIPTEGMRVYYVRYADDFIIGVNGTYDQAVKIRKEVAKFLLEELKLKLNMDKTHITNIRKSRAKFLGAEIKTLSSRTSNQKMVKSKTSTSRTALKRVPNHIIMIMAPLETIAKRLADQGMCRINN